MLCHSMLQSSTTSHSDDNCLTIDIHFIYINLFNKALSKTKYKLISESLECI